jgi:hypothetical protein
MQHRQVSGLEAGLFETRVDRTPRLTQLRVC